MAHCGVFRRHVWPCANHPVRDRMSLRNVILGVLQVGVRITVISASNSEIRNLGHGFIVNLVGFEPRNKYVLTLVFGVRRKSKVELESTVTQNRAQ
jgi:hypothetical protein